MNHPPSTIHHPLPAEIEPEFWARVVALAAKANRPPFRGGAVENRGGAPMGKGHGNEGKPFDIETACYLKPIFADYDRARREGRRLKLVLFAGVKTIKSFTGEVCAAEHVCHGRGDVALFFTTGETADVGATTRILDDWRGIPNFARKLETITSRFDDTKGALKFPDKTVFILAANLSNTQQKNLAMVMLQDAFLTERTGVIYEMLARTTQYEKEAIIFLESQGGEKDDDFDRQWQETNQQELHVRCPHCDTSHIWNWKAWDMVRGEDFVAKLPIADCRLPIEEQERKRAELTALLKSEARRRCGFKRGPDELIKLPDGGYNEAAVLRETYFECYHCGGAWRDDGEFGPTRIGLDVSSHYVASRPEALEFNVGYNVPQWINRRLSWGKMMLEKLQAQKTADELGNYEPLKKWWQKVAARAWDKDMTSKAPERMPASFYDEKEARPGEKVRISATDCQFNLTHLVYTAWAIGDGTPPRLLHYEWVKPPSGIETDHEKREWAKNRVRALDKEFGIAVMNSMKDAGHRPDLVREWAAEDAVFGKMRVGHRITQKWATYGLLIGDERVSYRWEHPGRKPTWERFKRKETVLVDAIKDGQKIRLPVSHQLWSNPSIKEIAARWRDGDGAPRIEVHDKWLRDTGKEGFQAQMHSERKVPWKGRPGKERWDNEGRANHAWDCWCMVIVRMDQLEYLNSFGSPQSDETEG
jgi:hypothetical protein